jgi:hypothetical protein
MRVKDPDNKANHYDQQSWHIFLFNKTNKMHEFPKFYFVKKTTYLGHYLCPSSGVFYCTFHIGIFLLMTACRKGQDSILTLLVRCHQTCKKYTNVDCTVENCWWWIKEIPETCSFFDKIKFGKFVRLVGFIKKKFVTMHGHMNLKLT